MNLTNFLKQTDEITAKYSGEQLKAFIHDIGRILPEHCREDFLRRLKAIGEKTKEKTKEEETVHEFNESYKLIRNNLKVIDSQEVTIEGILNEEYDDNGEEFYYQDSSGIVFEPFRKWEKHGCRRHGVNWDEGSGYYSQEIYCA